MSKLKVLAWALAALLVCVSCQPSIDSVPINSLRGMRLDDALHHISREQTVLGIVDASVVHGKPPSYKGSEDENSNWFVVASCADSETTGDARSMQLAVVTAADWAGTAADDEVDWAEYSDVIDCT